MTEKRKQKPVIIVPFKCSKCGENNRILFDQEAIDAYQKLLNQAKEAMAKKQFTGEKLDLEVNVNETKSSTP